MFHCALAPRNCGHIAKVHRRYVLPCQSARPCVGHPNCCFSLLAGGWAAASWRRSGSCCCPIRTASRDSLPRPASRRAPRPSRRVRSGATATSPRATLSSRGRVTAFIEWDGIFVSTPMWDLAHAVWQFAPVGDDADRWLDGWPSPPGRSARIAALVGDYRLGAGRADELAAMVVEVITGCTRPWCARSLRGIRRSSRWNAKGSSTRSTASTEPPPSSARPSPTTPLPRRV